MKQHHVTIPVQHPNQIITDQTEFTIHHANDRRMTLFVKDFAESDPSLSNMSSVVLEAEAESGDTVLLSLEDVYMVRRVERVDNFYRFEPLNPNSSERTLIVETHLNGLKIYGRVLQLVRTF